MPRAPFFTYVAWAALWAPLGCSDSGVSAASCPASSQNVDGRCVKECQARADCLATEDCLFEVNAAVGLCGPAQPGPTQIRAFEITPAAIRPGAKVLVSYAVVNATGVELALRTQSGEPSVFFQNDSALVGQVVSPEINEDAEVILLVTGPRGQLVSEQLPVEVSGRLVIESFQATPDTVLPGTETVLSWAVSNAVGPIVITRNGADDIVIDDGDPSGAVSVLVGIPTTFTLRATGVDGAVETEEALVRVQNVVVDHFEVAPTAVRGGDGAILTWATRGADRIVLQSEGVQSRMLYDSTNADFAANGRFVVLPSIGATRYSIRAFAGPQFATASDGVVLSVPPPGGRITGFEVRPNVLLVPGPVTFEWTAGPPQAQVSVSLNGEVDPAIAESGDTRNLSNERTTRALLQVSTPGGVARALRRVWATVEEEEPDNNERAGATEATDLAVAGELSPAPGEVDWMSVRVEGGGSVRTTFLSDCEHELTLELWSGDARLDQAEGPCPEVSATNLDAGTYAVRLAKTEDESPIRYLLGIASDGPRCGDGVWVRDVEECDDNNLRPGDGCSPDCRIEPEYNYISRTLPTLGWEPVPANALALPLLPYEEGQPRPASDRGFAMVRLPVPFRYFGRSYPGLVVHADGFVAFHPDIDAASATPATVWGTARPNAVIALYGADLDFGDQRPRVWVGPHPDQPEDVLWIDFSAAQTRGGVGDLIQARLGLASGGGILLRYGELPDAEPFFSGIEDHTGTRQFSSCPAGRCTVDERPRAVTFILQTAGP